MINNAIKIIIENNIILEPLAQFEYINFNKYKEEYSYEILNEFNYLNITWMNNYGIDLVGKIQEIIVLPEVLLKEIIIFWNNTIFSFFLIFLFFLSILLVFISKLYIIPTNWEYIIIKTYNFVLNIIETQVGKKAQKYLPYVFTIFCLILIANILGMILYSFTITSHIMVTFTLGISSFIGLTILGFSVQKLSFLELFLPKGIPAALLPILVVVEVISYTSRALSLSIRLFANLMSGHTLLHILSFFASKLAKLSYILAIFSFILIIAIIFLELCIAMLQAYVFTILVCIYLNDSVNKATH